jgi:hypothetical protein
VDETVCAAGLHPGSQGGVLAESADRIFVLNRGELKLPDKRRTPSTARGIRSVRRPRMRRPSCETASSSSIATARSSNPGRSGITVSGRPRPGITCASTRTIRIATCGSWDDNRHQVFEFTNDGKSLVMDAWRGGRAGPRQHALRASDRHRVLPDGTFFVTDGYVNTRVVKFDKTGKA